MSSGGSLVAASAAGFVRLIGRTLRLRWAGRERLTRPVRAGEPVVLALLHGRAPILLCALRGLPVVALASGSRDGRRAAALLGALGYGVVVGSSSRGGAAGLLGLIRAIRGGRVPAIAVDGPRGPAETVAPGVAGLAARTGAWVVPVAASCRRGWWLRSWDRARLPAPFSAGVVLVGRPLRAGPGEDAEELRRRIGESLRRLHRRADALCGGPA